MTNKRETAPPMTHNKQNTDAPFVDMAPLNLWKEIVVVAQPAFIPLRSIPAGCGVLLNVSNYVTK
jgi:hypothetical protein